MFIFNLTWIFGLKIIILFQMVDWVLRFLNRVCSVYPSIDEIVQADERQDNGREQLQQEGNLFFIYMVRTLPFYIIILPRYATHKHTFHLVYGLDHLLWLKPDYSQQHFSQFKYECMIRSDYIMFIFSADWRYCFLM